jgi:hypothetical protein
MLSMTRPACAFATFPSHRRKFWQSKRTLTTMISILSASCWRRTAMAPDLFPILADPVGWRHRLHRRRAPLRRSRRSVRPKTDSDSSDGHLHHRGFVA